MCILLHTCVRAQRAAWRQGVAQRRADDARTKEVKGRNQVRSGQVFSPLSSGPSMGTRALARLDTRTIGPHGYRHTRYNRVYPALAGIKAPNVQSPCVCSLSLTMRQKLTAWMQEEVAAGGAHSASGGAVRLPSGARCQPCRRLEPEVRRAWAGWRRRCEHWPRRR